MTKPSLSWIDRERVASLLRPATTSAAEPASASQPPPTIVPSGAPSVRSERTPFHPPSGPMEVRLEAYLDWIEGVAPSLASFVADESGHSLASRCENRALVGLSATAMALLEEARRALDGGSGRLTIAVDAAGTLHLAEVETAWGRFAVAVLVERALDELTVKRLQNALAMALVE